MQSTTIEAKDFTRVNNDTNGNPRYVIHFTKLISDKDEAEIRENFGASLAINPLNFTSYCYDEAVLKAKKIGGKRFHNKQYGGGIVFQHANVNRIVERVNELLNK